MHTPMAIVNLMAIVRKNCQNNFARHVIRSYTQDHMAPQGGGVLTAVHTKFAQSARGTPDMTSR